MTALAPALRKGKCKRPTSTHCTSIWSCHEPPRPSRDSSRRHRRVRPRSRRPGAGRIHDVAVQGRIHGYRPDDRAGRNRRRGDRASADASSAGSRRSPTSPMASWGSRRASDIWSYNNRYLSVRVRLRYTNIGVTANYHFQVKSNPKVDPFLGLGLGNSSVSTNAAGGLLERALFHRARRHPLLRQAAPGVLCRRRGRRLDAQPGRDVRYRKVTASTRRPGARPGAGPRRVTPRAAGGDAAQGAGFGRYRSRSSR